MPGSVKVKIIAARNLPIMDRSTFLTDAFVEVRIGNEFFKTDVVKRSLNPQWNSEWIIFELDDQQLQEEVLQIRVLDHDTYSAHDSIGRVYIDLNALLVKKNNRCLSGWLSIYDTMHGIRGEINVVVRVDLFSDVSKFRKSSVGVKFFYSSCIPVGFNVITLFGFVEELVMMDDPEHQWREKLRTSRASNETRQRLFSKLSGELQRKIGVKVLEMGGNSVIGYQLHFDLEGETGVVIRGIGTVAELCNVKTDSSSSPTSPTTLDVNNSNIFESKPNNTCKEADEVFSTKPMAPSIPPIMSKKLFDLGVFPFLTISLAPPNFIKHFGSVVSVKSVKLIEKSQSGDERECRDAWWLELRTEISSHMRIMNCNAVLGYSENCIIDEDVCVLTGYGTAVFLDTLQEDNSGHISDTIECNACLTSEVLSPCNGLISTSTNSKCSTHHPPNLNIDIARKYSGKIVKVVKNKLSCQLCHLPEGLEGCIFTNVVTLCRICNQVSVPEVIFSTTEIPEMLDFCGKPALIQARVCRYKKENKGELCAKEINDILPFLEYEMHYKLVQDLSMKGLNAIFGLTVRLCVGQNLVVAIGTGTGVFLPPLPLPMIPKSNHHTVEEENLILKIKEFRTKSRDFFKISPNKINFQVSFKTEKNAKAKTPPNDCFQMTASSSQCKVSNKIFHRSVSESSKRTSLTDNVFIDTGELNHDYINSVIKEGFPPPAITMETINSVKCKFSKNYPQMIFRFVRSIPLFNVEGSGSIVSLTSETLDVFMQEFHSTLWLKLRRLMPCVVAGIDYTFNVTEDDGFEAMVTGFVSSTDVYYNEDNECGNYQAINLDNVFSNRGDNAENVVLNELITDVNINPQPRFLISPLSSVAGYAIDAYLGSLNFFFVRETTAIREFGGVSGFIQALIGEVQTVVASQTMAIGGSGLLSCHITEMILNYPTNGRQMNSAQCLINICGDMIQGHF